MDRYRSRDVRRGRGRGGRVNGAVWMGIACKQQTTNNTNLLPQPSQLTAIAPAEPIPPHYILLALCLLARPSQSVFRVQCLCVSPPSDLRLQWTSTPRRVRAAHPSASLVSLSLTLSLPPASPLLLCSTQRGTVCCTVSEPGAAAVVVVVLPSTRTTHLHIRIQNTHHEG